MSNNSTVFTTIKSRPIITRIDPIVVDKDKNNYNTINVYGYGFWSNKNVIIDGIETTSVEVPFFSKSHVEILRAFVTPRFTYDGPARDDVFDEPLVSYDLYQQTPQLQTKYPAFSGVEVEVTAITENALSIKLPPVSCSAYVDIIIANRTGYSRSQTENTTYTKYASTSGMLMIPCHEL